MRGIHLGHPSSELWRQNEETADNPQKAFSGIIRKEFQHDTAVGSRLETSELRMIFLRRIIVVDDTEVSFQQK